MPHAAKGPKPVMGIRFVQKTIEGYSVKVPVMVNLRDIDPTTELNYDKTEVKKWLSSWTPVDLPDFVRAAKRRKLV